MPVRRYEMGLATKGTKGTKRRCPVLGQRYKTGGEREEAIAIVGTGPCACPKIRDGVSHKRHKRHKRHKKAMPRARPKITGACPYDGWGQGLGKGVKFYALTGHDGDMSLRVVMDRGIDGTDLITVSNISPPESRVQTAPRSNRGLSARARRIASPRRTRGNGGGLLSRGGWKYRPCHLANRPWPRG